MAKKSLIERLKEEYNPLRGEESLLNVALSFLRNPKDIIAFYNEFIGLQKKPKEGISPKQSATLKIMCYLSPYSGYYKSSDEVHQTNRQRWVEALHGKMLFEPVAQIQTEIYRCPICEEEFVQTFVQAKRGASILERVREHVKIPLGNPIPEGVAFKEKGKYYFTKFGGGEIASNHGYDQACELYHPEVKFVSGRIDYIQYGGRKINSKELKQKLREGKAQFLNLEETKRLSRDYHTLSKYSSSFKIRTPNKEFIKGILHAP